MTKLYCDMCGKRIRPHSQLTAVLFTVAMVREDGPEFKFLVCRACGDKLIAGVQGLKDE